jgi:hypothetical protein
MANEVLKVSISGINAIEVDKLGGVAQDVQQGVFVLNPSVFTGTPTVTEAELVAGTSLFNSKRSAYKQGGLGAKKPYEDAHAGLLGLLIGLAPYVDVIADGDEDTLKMSKLPYDTGVNDTGALIAAGALPTLLTFIPGATGIAKVSCAAFGKGAKYVCIAAQGSELPVGTYMSPDGQIIIPTGGTMPTCIVNINGKRAKTLVNMIPKTDYYLYYIMMCGGNVSGLSISLKIASGN